EVVEGQQRSAEGGGFDPETLRAGWQELKAQRAAQDLMFAPVQAREVAPSDDARAVDGGGREIRALAQRYFGGHPAARKGVDQMSMRAGWDITERQGRWPVLDLNQVIRQIDIRRSLSQLAEPQRFVLKRRAGDFKTI